MAVGNFVELLRLSGISSSCYGCREFRRVATLVRNSAVLAVGNFDVLPRLSGICGVAAAVRNVAVLAVGSFVVLVQFSGISLCCCSCQ